VTSSTGCIRLDGMFVISSAVGWLYEELSTPISKYYLKFDNYVDLNVKSATSHGIVHRMSLNLMTHHELEAR
jgi:hypothetical protein